MLYPLGGIPVSEYDATYVMVPTSRQSHHSDTILASVEMLVRNDASEAISFPFMVLSTDPGTGASNPSSVEPRLLNGSFLVEVDEVDEVQAAELARQRAAAVGADAALQGAIRRWAEEALAKAERIRIGRTHIRPGESRRIVAQQRLRVQPDDEGRFQFVTIAPSPLLTVATRGRVSVYALLPFEDEDVRVEVLPAPYTEMGFGYEITKIKNRQIASWFWQNDPIFKLGYRYV